MDGTPRLRQRPVGPAAEALQKLGTAMHWIGETGFLPVEITSRGLNGGDVFVDASKAASSYPESSLPLQWLAEKSGWNGQSGWIPGPT